MHPQVLKLLIGFESIYKFGSETAKDTISRFPDIVEQIFTGVIGGLVATSLSRGTNSLVISTYIITLALILSLLLSFVRNLFDIPTNRE